MSNEMSEIFATLISYFGNGALPALYAAALIYLLVTEKNRITRLLLLYMPLVFLCLFLLPPFHAVYAKIEGADTYYRLLWLIPMNAVIAYGAVKVSDLLPGLIPGKGRAGEKNTAEAGFSGTETPEAGSTGTAAAMKPEAAGPAGTGVTALCCAGACALVVLCGSLVYSKDNINIRQADNRLHLPQMVMNICDIIMNDTGGEVTMAAMPVGLTQFVRQYDSRIQMPYGREMQMPVYEGFYHSVYDAMENTEPIDPDKLVAAMDEYDCNYAVLEAARPMSKDPKESGLVLIGNTDGYDIYVCPSIVSAWKR